MFHIYHSNQLDILKDIFCYIIQKYKNKNCLNSELILVPNKFIAQWLKIEIAYKLGIYTNYEFITHEKFFLKFFKSIFNKNINIFSKNKIKWILMLILPTLSKNKKFLKLKNLINDEIKCFNFSYIISNLFEKYLIFRPDWIEKWDKGNLIKEIGEKQILQANIWNAITNEIKKNKIMHIYNIYKKLNVFFLKKKKLPIWFPDRIFIFGITYLPPIYINILKKIGHYIDVHILFHNPCRYFWENINNNVFKKNIKIKNIKKYSKNKYTLNNLQQTNNLFKNQDKKTNNFLLEAWGKQGRDILSIFSQLDEIIEIDAFVEFPNNCILNILKNDILNLENNDMLNYGKQFFHKKKKRILTIEDMSISFNVCHTPYREIEVLYNSIISIMKENSNINYRDIIVMITDIEKYTPAIKAVFGLDKYTDRYIPYVISDRPACYINPIINEFIRILDLPIIRFTVQEVLSFLELPELSLKFGIKEKDLKIIKYWVKESGIIWGLDDETISKIIVTKNSKHTWSFGLKRMLLGYAMNSETGIWKGIPPYDESSKIANLIGYLSEFLIKLRKWRNNLSKPRFMKEWLPFVNEIIDDFFISNFDNKIAIALIIKEWNKIIQDSIKIGYTRKVSINLIKNEFIKKLNNEKLSKNFFEGKITFCKIMPMRSIPFKIVCLLGMNEKKFPRKVNNQYLDLMAHKPRLGDINTIDEDRYLFLELILSAKYKLYISFIGYAIKDNSPKYPSVIISELIDYIKNSFYLKNDKNIDPEIIAERVKKHLYKKHSRINKDFLVGTRSKINNKSKFISKLHKNINNNVSINDLKKFYIHPVRTWFQKGLSVFFPPISKKIYNDEPFLLDNITKFNINKKILNFLILNKNTDLLYKQFNTAGKLPYGAFGKIFWEQQCNKMYNIAKKVQKCYKKTNNIEIYLNLDKYIISGIIKNIQDNGIIRWIPNKINIKDGLLLWLEHLSYCAMGGSGESKIFGINGKWHFLNISKNKAIKLLISLVSGYFKGMISPLFLLHNSGEAWLKKCFDYKTKSINYDSILQQKAYNQIIKVWNGDKFNFGESKDPYLNRLIPKLNKKYIQYIIKSTELYLLPMFIFNI